MAKFDNLSIEDLREFIGLLTGDTYFPEQLLDFDAITLADAIRYLQENNSTKNSYTLCKCKQHLQSVGSNRNRQLAS